MGAWISVEASFFAWMMLCVLAGIPLFRLLTVHRLGIERILAGAVLIVVGGVAGALIVLTRTYPLGDVWIGGARFDVFPAVVTLFSTNYAAILVGVGINALYDGVRSHRREDFGTVRDSIRWDVNGLKSWMRLRSR